ncbi:hypothetical protein CRG98_047522 [Punica granatum]|uniref:Uncharacterized protein n=1 Tax=Punica granatum TaxID=22663 RepID=A0A2I0HK22_PUNGR|nr:hypothetical protein CRG98_047522 [Punica granatum]
MATKKAMAAVFVIAVVLMAFVATGEAVTVCQFPTSCNYSMWTLVNIGKHGQNAIHIEVTTAFENRGARQRGVLNRYPM